MRKGASEGATTHNRNAQPCNRNHPARPLDIFNRNPASNEVIFSTHTSLEIALQERDILPEAMAGVEIINRTTNQETLRIED